MARLEDPPTWPSLVLKGNLRPLGGACGPLYTVWKKVSESEIFPRWLSFWEVFTSALRELRTLSPVDGAKQKGLSVMQEQEDGRSGGAA